MMPKFCLGAYILNWLTYLALVTSHFCKQLGMIALTCRGQDSIVVTRGDPAQVVPARKPLYKQLETVRLVSAQLPAAPARP